MTDAHQQARAILAEALRCPVDEITPVTSLETCAAWDSITHINVMLLIEEHLGRTLVPTEIMAISSLSGIEKLLDASS